MLLPQLSASERDKLMSRALRALQSSFRKTAGRRRRGQRPHDVPLLVYCDERKACREYVGVLQRSSRLILGDLREIQCPGGFAIRGDGASSFSILESPWPFSPPAASAPWMAFMSELFRSLCAAGFSTELPDPGAAWFRASDQNDIYARCVADVDSAAYSLDDFMEHHLLFLAAALWLLRRRELPESLRFSILPLLPCLGHEASLPDGGRRMPLRSP